MWGRGVYLGVSHSSHCKRAEYSGSQFLGVPLYSGELYLCLHPLSQNDQIQHGNTYGEGNVFSRVQPRRCVCTNAWRGLSATAQFPVLCCRQRRRPVSLSSWPGNVCMAQHEARYKSTFSHLITYFVLSHNNHFFWRFFPSLLVRIKNTVEISEFFYVGLGAWKEFQVPEIFVRVWGCLYHCDETQKAHSPSVLLVCGKN